MEQPKTINRTQEAIKKISPELKQFVRELFQTAVKKTIADGKLPIKDPKHMNPDILSIAQHFKDVCDSASIDHLNEKDRKIFKFFRATLQETVSTRIYTAVMTNFMIEFVDMLMWISIWYNHIYCQPTDRVSTDIVFNRKSLASELTKALLKNVNIVEDGIPQHALIRDLFRGNLTTAESNVECLRKFRDTVLLILTNPNSDDAKLFYEWVEASPKLFGGMKIPKENILDFKEFKFELTFVKDYISQSKGMYRAWQGTFIISNAPDPYKHLCGKMFEFKFWTSVMHENSEIGPASHDEYKREVDQFINEVFSVANVQSGDIEFYSPGFDLNAIIKARNVYGRNVSCSTIPETSS